MSLITRQYLKDIFRQKKLKISVEPFFIQVESAFHILYKDIYDLLLKLGGNKWEWLDANGVAVKPEFFIKAVIRILRDLTFWPFRYFMVRQAVYHYKYPESRNNRLTATGDCLFLRTDHSFNIISGGSVGHLSGVINGFRQQGVTTLVISSDYLQEVDREQGFLLESPDFNKCRNIPEMPELLYNKQLMKTLRPKLRDGKFRFIYQRYSLGNFTGLFLAEEFSLPYICEYNGSFVWMVKHWGGRPLLHGKLLEKIELMNLKYADLVVVVSEALKDELMGRGVDEKRILVNPNGVDTDKYSPEIKGDTVRQKYGLENKFVIGFIGTFGPWHGADFLVKAFALFCQQNPQQAENVRLLMVGDGLKMTEVRELTEHHKLQDKVILTGLIPQHEGPAHLAACDVLVNSTLPNPDGSPFFGSPTKLFEYMAMGKAILCSNMAQMGEILQNEENGLLFTPGDKAGFCACLGRLIEDKSFTKLLGKKARNLAVEKYSWHKHTEKILNEINSL